jgi:phenylalanyl-tRNA synthetase beta chain
MIVSWSWLKQYVPLDMPIEEFERRLMMAGLNHEATEEVAGDLAIDLEVTSNRPDCLGHIGVAREAAVLFGHPLTIPTAVPREGATAVDQLVAVRIDCPDLCSRYTARVIQGVKIAPSPTWLARRLQTVGVMTINNVVDISNYVMLECGQPLHTFDFARLKDRRIVVRRARPGESIEAIDHKSYALTPEMCMICDSAHPVAIGGVMGGAGTEIASTTRDVLIEAADFSPVSIRTTARQLNLHSDSAYRFERRIDPEGLDWASRRCCELILELAGGTLAAGFVDVGSPQPAREPVRLRLTQLKRVLGIDVPAERVRAILLALGNVEHRSTALDDQASLSVVPPSWRRDLTREIDLIEEVARIHGYEAIPEDVSVPMAPSARRRDDRVLEKIRRVLTAAGFDEAMTLSAVDEATSTVMSPWTEAPPLRAQMPVIRGAHHLRRSLTPSLLAARRTNEALSNAEIELFEIAKVYLPRQGALPQEELMLSITSGRPYSAVKGMIEAIVRALTIATPLEAVESAVGLLDPAASCGFRFQDETLGFVGQLDADALRQFDLRGPTTVAELRLAPLMAVADLVPRAAIQSAYPAVTRDLNLVVDEAVRWADVAATVRTSGGPSFEALDYRDTYRDGERLGDKKKSLLLTITLRRAEGTLTGQQADQIRDQVVAACREKHGAELRA